jgi:hypothetical protein
MISAYSVGHPALHIITGESVESWGNLGGSGVRGMVGAILTVELIRNQLGKKSRCLIGEDCLESAIIQAITEEDNWCRRMRAGAVECGGEGVGKI